MRRSYVYSLVAAIAVAVLALGATFVTGDRPLLGLDLRGGVSVVLQPQGTVDNATLQQAVNIIERRVNGLGVANSVVQRQGRDVVINLPGIKDSQNALNVLGTTAQLYFRPVLCELPAYAAAVTSPSTTVPAVKPGATTVPGITTVPAVTTVPAATPTTGAKASGVRQAPVQARLTAAIALPAAVTATSTPAPAVTSPAVTAPPVSTPAVTTPAIAPAVPAATAPTAAAVSPGAPIGRSTCSASNAAQLPSTPPDKVTQHVAVLVPAAPGSGLGNVRFVLGPADLTGRAVNTAFVSVSSTGAYTVQMQFTASGGVGFDRIAAVRNKFYSATTTNVQSLEAIELDGAVESAPTIQSASFGGTASISGSFTSTEASSLALVLKYGSLPVRFTPQSVQTVSATLGKDSLHAGLLAGLGGIVVVMLYMVLYYRALGLVVLLGLGVGGSILYSILTFLSQTSSLALTLAGVTGIIVSVGITVDSYVVYFERLKDEVRSGRTIRQSTERSFSRAFRTVLTADFVSFLAALILYLLTVGDVRGFAFTLGLSTLLDVATAYFFIRPMVILVGRHRTFTDARILGVARGLGAASAGGTG